MKNIFKENIDKYGIINLLIWITIPIIIAMIIYGYDNYNKNNVKNDEKLDYEVYCYFNLLAWKEKETITDDIAYSKCASKFGITKEQAKESYKRVESSSWKYQDKYPDIYNKYASQYYN